MQLTTKVLSRALRSEPAINGIMRDYLSSDRVINSPTVLTQPQVYAMDATQWLGLFERAFRGMGEDLEQVLQLDSCREHWIQAEISLHAWFKENSTEIWTDLPIGERRKADLYATDDNGSTVSDP